MPPDEVIAFVSARTKWFRLAADTTAFQRKSSAVAIDAEGRWTIVPGAPELAMARDAVRDAVEVARRSNRSSVADIEASLRVYEKQRNAHADQLAAHRRVLVHAFPARAPEAVVLLDINERTLTTLVGDELSKSHALLEPYDMICGVDIRTTLRLLGFDPGARRLGELGPPQKTVQVAGGVLKLTTEMFIVGSCRIPRPLATEKQLAALLSRGKRDPLAERLESDAKALFAMYQYGMLQGAVRLRRGNLDEMFPVPWHHRDEQFLYRLLCEAFELGMGLVAVVGEAPPWNNPWASAQRLHVVQGRSQYDVLMYDEWGRWIDDREVQLARLEATIN